MNRLGKFFWNIFFWTYQRGSWQWDLCCLFFLIVIFTTPQDFLAGSTHNPMNPDEIRALVLRYLHSVF
jgi:hypothetical protein